MSFVSLTHPPTLGFSELKTPPDHGDVLVAPRPHEWIPAARANHKALKDADTPLLKSTLGEWRRRTREAVTGSADRLIDRLRRSEQQRQVDYELPLSSPPLLWVMFVTALTSEWLLRRKYQLR